MKSKLLLTILIISLALSISGCTDIVDKFPLPTEEAEVSSAGFGKSLTYGIIIRDFSPSQLSVDSGDEVELGLDIENVGAHDAENIAINLFQKSGFSIVSENSVSATSLLSPDLKFEQPGERLYSYWVMAAPSVSVNQQKFLKARISYDYSSLATSNIHLVSRDIYNEQGPGAFSIQSTTSSAPVSFAIYDVPPIKVSSSPLGSVDVSLNIVIRNTGSGSVSGNIQNFVVYTVRGPVRNDVTSGCSDDVSGGEVSLFGKTQERSVKCDLSLDYLEDITSYTIEVLGDYTYIMDTDPVSILVKE
ncbi:TPA: hypothetical protein H1008_02565 [archaeon]|nr:hypothetical protein [Candidatus Undinarchaeales archaeon SRR5007147.bin71]